MEHTKQDEKYMDIVAAKEEELDVELEACKEEALDEEVEACKEEALDKELEPCKEEERHEGVESCLESMTSSGKELDLEEVRRYYQLAETLGLVETEFQQLESCVFADALERYQLLAEQNYLQAQQKLYHAFHDGIGIEQDQCQAIKWLKEIALHSTALTAEEYYILGYHYYTGEVLAQDYEKAFLYLQYAADGDHVEAQYLVAKCLLEGVGTPSNPELAISYLINIASRHKLASTELAGCYFHGIGVAPDISRCIQYLHEENCKDVPLLLAVAQQYYEGLDIQQNYRKAYLIYRCLWNIGNQEAQYYLGLCYLYGHGVQQNIVLALQDYFTPYNIQDLEVLYQVGKYYEEGVQFKGKEIPIAEDRAFAYYYQAALKGHVEAMYTVGQCYYFQMGVQEDLALAFQFYLQAAEHMHPEALYAVGCCYMQGSGVEIDEQKAIAYNEQAADAGYNIARYTMGEILENGLFVAVDQERAFGYYQKAVEDGHQPSLYKLITCYEQGIGVEKDESMVLRLSKVLAEQGDIPAIYRLGTALKLGTGIPKNPEESIQYFLQGAQLHDSKCQLECIAFDYKKYKVRCSWNRLLIYIIYINKLLQKQWKKIRIEEQLDKNYPVVADSEMQNETEVLYQFVCKIAKKRRVNKNKLSNNLFRGNTSILAEVLPIVPMIEHATSIITTRKKAFAEVKKVLLTLDDSQKELLVMCYACYVASKYDNRQAQKQYRYIQELANK